MATPLQQLLEMGQSPWYDNIRRGLVRSGGLRALRDRGVRGVTANPTIFEKAISGSTDYDESIRQLVRNGATAPEIYESLVLDDIRAAADVLRPVYDLTNGLDGYVSVEVSPKLAHDTRGTIEEAREFFSRIARANVMVKVPATDEGIPAIRQLIGEGLNINITLIFAVERYEQVMDAYLDGLEELVADGRPPDKIASVASFFVSRVDTEVDKRLAELIEGQREETRKALEGLLGKAAIANARIAYDRFRKKFAGERFAALRQKGARVQRPLWASTGTKNPAYRDVVYVEELIGPQTVSTMPPATLEAFVDHGRVEQTIDKKLDEARQTIRELEARGISMKEVTDTLLLEGVESFAESFESLERAIGCKSETLRVEVAGRQVADPARA